MATLEEEKISGLLSGWGLATRTCDTCSSAAALLYCRNDNAFLCGACDTNIHHRVRHHERVWICEVCEQAPASVTCKADAAALCTSCDNDIHSANPLAQRHERVPVVPFYESPAMQQAVAVSNTATANTTTVVDAGDSWLIPNPDFLYKNNDLDLFGFSNGGKNQENDNNNNNNHGFTLMDSVVPSHSNEINRSMQNRFDIDFSQHHKQHKQIISSINFSTQPSVSTSDIGIVPDDNTNSTSEVSYTFKKSTNNVGAILGDGGSLASIGVPQASILDRKARVLRYREKRKNRKFEKTIRYASRKAYAETRPRIKGRFAKRNESSDISEIDPIYEIGSIGFTMDHNSYSVVPSF